MSDTLGHVYVIQGHKGVKIGASKNPKQRVKTLKSGMGISETDVFISNPVLNFFEAEGKCHDNFSEKRMAGEFFDITFKDAVSFVNEVTPRPSPSLVAAAEVKRSVEEAKQCKGMDSLIKSLYTKNAKLNEKFLKSTVEAIDLYGLDQYIDKLQMCNSDFDLLLVRDAVLTEIIIMQSLRIEEVVEFIGTLTGDSKA